MVTCLKMATRLDDTTSRNPEIRKLIESLRDSPEISEDSSDRIDKIRLEVKTLPSGKPDCPHEKIIELYHEYCPTLPMVKIWRGSRKTHLKARWDEDPEHQTLEFWRNLFIHINQSAFLRGEAPGSSWKANLEFIVSQRGFINIIEHKYHEAQK